MLIIGAGFIGSEAASVCRELGLAVTVAERASHPLNGALGGVIGRIAAEMQRDHGVDLRTHTGVTAIEGDDSGHVQRVQLSDGSKLDVDVVLASLGSLRNNKWLEGSGLASGFWGVACDAGCRAFDINGLVTDNIFVAGDIARFPHVLFEYQFLSLEHWDNAVLGAEVAAHNMVSDESDRRPHLPLPAFWSGQFGVNIKSVGIPSFGHQIMFTQGSVKERRFAAVYGRRGRIVGAVTFDHGKWLQYYGRLIEALGSFPNRSRGLRSARRHESDLGRVPGPAIPSDDSRCRLDRPRPERARGRIPRPRPVTTQSPRFLTETSQERGEHHDS